MGIAFSYGEGMEEGGGGKEGKRNQLSTLLRYL